MKIQMSSGGVHNEDITYVRRRTGIPEICAFNDIAQRLKSVITFEPKATTSWCIPPEQIKGSRPTFKWNSIYVKEPLNPFKAEASIMHLANFAPILKGE